MNLKSAIVQQCCRRFSTPDAPCVDMAPHDLAHVCIKKAFSRCCTGTSALQEGNEGNEELLLPDAHPMLEPLHVYATDEEEYRRFSKDVHQMLHCHLQSQATIEEVLAADILQ